MSWSFAIRTGRFAEAGGLEAEASTEPAAWWYGGIDYNGTIFDDFIDGTRYNDRISGRDGDDTIYGWDGDDTLAGNDGRDEVYGEFGWDTVTGGDGRDYLDGGPGNDVVGGGQGTDTLYGGSGDDLLGGDGNADFLLGNDGRDTLVGGNGDDTLWGDAGDDTLDGGANIDTAVYELSFDRVEVRRTGPDTILIDLPDGSRDRLDFMEFAEFTDGIFSIGAATEEEGFVYRLYQAVYDRPADEGLDFWVDRMADGLSEEEVAAAFVDSPEYEDRYGTGNTDAELIDALYENVFGREADDAGRDFWLDQLAGPLEQEDMLLIFSESPENVAAYEQELEAGLFYI